ncbi:MAG: GvpL/GvpF family gas vesicle protein [Pseudomonadota bacterium]
MTRARWMMHGVLDADAPCSPILAPRLRQLRAGGLRALVSPAPLPAAPPAQRDNLERAALAHHAMLCAVSRDSDVLPFRFGQGFLSVTGAWKTLEVHAPSWRRRVAALSGKLEFCCRLEAPLGPTEDDPNPTATGRAYLSAALERRSRRASKAAMLQDAAGNVAALVEQRGLHCRQLTGESGVPRFDILVGRAGARDLRHQLEQEATRWAAHGVALHVAGPWPPYSFTAIAEHAHA